MKSLKKIVSVAFIIMLYAGSTYATSTDLTKNTGLGMEKKILIGVGALLVGLVLFIGYKMDKSVETKSGSQQPKTKPKKEKNIKKERTTEDMDMYKSLDEEDDTPYELEENEVYENEITKLDEANTDNTEETKLEMETEEDSSVGSTMAFNIDELNDLLVEGEETTVEENNEINNLENNDFESDEVDLDDEISELDELDELEDLDDDNDIFLEELKNFDVPVADVEDFSVLEDKNKGIEEDEETPRAVDKTVYTRKKQKEENIQTETDRLEGTVPNNEFLEQMEKNFLKNMEQRLGSEDAIIEEEKPKTKKSGGKKTSTSKTPSKKTSDKKSPKKK